MGLEDFDVDIKFGNGLEFETNGKPVSDSVSPSLTKEQEEALKEIVRDGFRAPVGASDKVHLVVGAKSYSVFNLSVSGVGIFLDDLDNINADSTIEEMILEINGNEFSLTGKIIHISQDEAQYLCGIDIVEMDNDCRRELLAFLQDSRNELFSKRN